MAQGEEEEEEYRQIRCFGRPQERLRKERPAFRKIIKVNRRSSRPLLLLPRLAPLFWAAQYRERPKIDRRHHHHHRHHPAEAESRCSFSRRLQPHQIHFGILRSDPLQQVTYG